MEEGIVPGGTDSLLYSLIFPKHEDANVDSLNTASSGQLMEKMEAARTVAQIKNESKAKQLARLEAASSKKRKSSDPDELNSEISVGAVADALSKKKVPFSRYRACTESTRKELEGKKHAARRHQRKNQNSEAVFSGKLESPPLQGNRREGKAEQRQPEFLEDSLKAPHHEVNSETVVGSKEQVWGENRQQTVNLRGFQGNTDTMWRHIKTCFDDQVQRSS